MLISIFNSRILKTNILLLTTTTMEMLTLKMMVILKSGRAILLILIKEWMTNITLSKLPLKLKISQASRKSPWKSNNSCSIKEAPLKGPMASSQKQAAKNPWLITKHKLQPTIPLQRAHKKWTTKSNYKCRVTPDFLKTLQIMKINYYRPLKGLFSK